MSRPWFTVDRGRTAPEVQLVAFPFAGGSASVFRAWPAWLPPTVELRAALLPGRERRVSDLPHDRIATLVSELADVFAEFVDPPFVLFGHSMGATVAYELTREMVARGLVPPAGLIVSGQRAPDVVDPHPHLHGLPDAEFVEAVRELGGTPPEVFAHPELVDLVLPALRADFTAVETYEWTPGPPIDIPLVAFAGDHDRVVEPADVAGWTRHSTVSAEVVTFPGGHFFLTERTDDVARRAGHDALRLAGAQPPA